jgi:hypothetical protein
MPKTPRAKKAPKSPAPAVEEPESFDLNTMYKSNIDSYVLPSGKLYASGMKKKGQAKACYVRITDGRS